MVQNETLADQFPVVPLEKELNIKCHEKNGALMRIKRCIQYINTLGTIVLYCGQKK